MLNLKPQIKIRSYAKLWLIMGLLGTLIACADEAKKTQKQVDSGNAKLAQMDGIDQSLRKSGIYLASPELSATGILQLSPAELTSAQQLTDQFIRLGQEVLSIANSDKVQMANRPQVEESLKSAREVAKLLTAQIQIKAAGDRRTSPADNFWKSYHQAYEFLENNKSAFGINLTQFNKSKDSSKLGKLSQENLKSLKDLAQKTVETLTTVISGREQLGHPEEAKQHKVELKKAQELLSAINKIQAPKAQEKKT